MLRQVIAFLLLVSSVAFGSQNSSFELGNGISHVEATEQSVGRTVIDLDIANLNYTQETVDGLTRYSISLPDEFGVSRGSFLGPDSSVLPAITRLIAIPFDSDPTFHIVNSSYVDFDNITLAGAGAEELDALKSASPTLVQGQEAGIMRDLRLYSLVISPVQYDPQSKKLRVYDNIEVEVQHSGSKITAYDNQISEAFAPIYRSLVDNPQVFDPIRPTRGAYWIICPDAYQSLIQPLADWKTAKGFPVVMIPKSGIIPNTYTNIHNYILARFDSCQIKPDYITIIGDVSTDNSDNNIATKEYTNPHGLGDIESDNYYTFLHGNDYFPEVLIGRISVANTSDISYYLSKFFTYERTPYMADTTWYQKGTTVAGDDGYGFASPRLTKLWCREAMLQAGFTQVDTFFGGYTPLGDISNAINNGRAYVNYRGYGYANEWWPPTWGLSEIEALSNSPKFGIMTSIVCATGDYNDGQYPVCMGEHWIRANNKGGAGFIGNSNHYAHTRWTNAIDVGIYWGLFYQHVATMAQAEFMGKMILYYSFPEDRGTNGEVELYFNSYNDLGDPEINCWTGVPRRMVVSHPDSMSLGENRIEVNVSDSMGGPIEGAGVCIWKGSEVFQAGFTGVDGNYEFFSNPLTVGDMRLTVTSQGHIPVEDTITYYTNALVMGYFSHIVDDDSSDGSFGNGDGIANPSETIGLSVMLKNFGISDTAFGVTSILRSESPAINVMVDSLRYGNVAPGESSGTSIPYVIHIAPNVEDGENARLLLDISDSLGHEWQSIINMPISAPNITINSVLVSGGDGDTLIDRGETVDLVVNAINSGHLGLYGASAVLRTSDSLVQITDSTAIFGDCAPGDSINNNNDHFTVTVSPDAYVGRQLNFNLAFTGAGPVQINSTFSKRAGIPQSSDPIGPDAYGYYCFDNTDSTYELHPTYNWLDIDTTVWSHVSLNDDAFQTISLPLEVKYYGQIFNQVTICDNGFVALGQTWYNNFFNTPIPGPQNPPAMLAPFWDDFRQTSGQLKVYYHQDTTAGWFAIGWKNARDDTTSQLETFEIVILDRALWPTETDDNDIIFQYFRALNPTYISVGICSPDRREGIQYLYNNGYTPGAATLAQGRAIKFTTGSLYQPVAIRGGGDLPSKFSLSQNYPNPFNASTSIKFSLSAAQHVTIDIFNLLGQKVQRIADADFAAGTHSVIWNAGQSTSGVYFYRLSSKDETVTKRMMLLK